MSDKASSADLQPISFKDVVSLLDSAVGGPHVSVPPPHDAFWRDVTRDEFVQLVLPGGPIITLNDGVGSRLIQSLRGQGILRMPLFGPGLSNSDVRAIEHWIDSGCPEESTSDESDAIQGLQITESTDTSPPTSAISYIKIHPSIGIARLGNHPTAYFVGPERPFERVSPPGGFKADYNGQLKVKRQAARFRLFGYDANGNVVKEITKDDAEIQWHLRLANKKAVWETFHGPSRNPHTLRNSSVPLKRRKDLIIGPASVTVPCNTDVSKTIDGLSFLSYDPTNGKTKEVNDILLGELRIEDRGSALVLGGEGRSNSPIGTDLRNYANNPGWFDDIADGPVDATVTLRENGHLRPVDIVKGAWVIVAPPNFAPTIQAVVTLYDMLFDRATRTTDARVDVPHPPSFSQHIYPLLEASLNVRHIYATKERGQNSNYHYFSHLLEPSASLQARTGLLTMIRVPQQLRGQFPGSSLGTMPKLRDGSDNWSSNGLDDSGFTVTQTQYMMLHDWSTGNVDIAGPNGQPPEPANDITPDGLDRAALMNCVGGAFFPGIEAGWFLESSSAVQMAGQDYLRIRRDQLLFADPIEAGDITKHMAVPWQADFYSCTRYGTDSPGWWPSARPNEVNVPGEGRQPWDRRIANGPDAYLKMSKKWWKLGFVVEENNQFVEVQRS